MRPWHPGFVTVRAEVYGCRECAAFKNFALCDTLPACWDVDGAINFVFKKKEIPLPPPPPKEIILKIKAEDLRQIAAGFARIQDDQRFRTAHAASMIAGHSDIRIAWDCFRLMAVNGDSMKWLCDDLYSYMNDTHVTTALLSEYRKMKARMGV